MIEFHEITTNLFNASLMVYTFYLFFDYFAIKRPRKLLRSSMFILISVLLTCILTFAPMGITRTILIFMIPLLVSLLFRLKWYSHILLTTLVFSFACISEFIVTILISWLFSVNAQIATRGAFQILGIVLSKMIMILILAIMKLLKYKNAYSLTIRKALTLFLIPASTVIISILHINLFVNFPEESQALVRSSLISYIVLIASNIIVFHLINNSYKESEKEKQLATVTELLQAQATQYEQMQEHNQEVMKIRHDQKNFIIGLISELENGSVDNTKHLLKNQLNILKRSDDFDFNNIVSAVVKTKSNHAGRYGITIDFQYSELHRLQISPVDIAIILGNALDNAIEATQKTSNADKIIHTLVKINRDLIVIIIRNPTEKPVDISNLISTKRNNGTQGFGIASIEELTKKHDGEVIFKCDNLLFETNIIMRNIKE